MTRALHVIVGPNEHGVVRHAADVAQACGDDVLRFADASIARIPAGYDVVHIPYTDRLFAATCEASASAFERLSQAVAARGSLLSVVLHDLPFGPSTLQARRREAYRRVSARASGVVVSSHLELQAAEFFLVEARVARVIALPVGERVLAQPDPTGRSVGVLGFVYPDRGYEDVLDELPAGSELLALGRAADGHHALAEQIAEYAARAGLDWHLTGFLPDEELSARLLTVAVPVAPNRRVAASASIATWLAHGRRPLVAGSAYAVELDTLWPQTIQMYDADRPGALGAAIGLALEDPASTVLGEGIATGPSLAEVADAYTDYFRGVSASTVAVKAIAVGAHRPVVPANRWDLLADHWPNAAPTVSVVVPYYESQRQLDLVLTGLSLQTHPAHRLQVVVADDGSRLSPDLAAAGQLDCRCVRQPDMGFRAAAARNLGAAAAEGQILAFLDADTIPEPDYVRQISRLPALLASALVVGRPSARRPRGVDAR